MNNIRLSGFRIALQGMVASVDAAKVGRFLRLVSTRAMLLGIFHGAAWPAAATQEYILPTLFDVVDVAADDVLNIREAPDARSSIIGTLAPDARNIEVVAYDETGQWAQINVDERSGWAALRYLAYRVDVWNPGTLPPMLNCLGNEPFWSFRLAGDRLMFSTPDSPDVVLRIDAILATGIFRDPRRSVSAQGDSSQMTAVLVPLACSDGMSDRAYGLDVTVILEGPSEPRMLTGCCSIDQR